MSSSEKIRPIVIVGLPNTGKSSVFNNLTGEYALVGNYPFTTVEMKRARARIGRDTYEVIDTPGLHALFVHSEEELAIRDLLFKEHPDVIIQCIDASQLKQSLTLTSDLLQLDIPKVIALNVTDEATQKGIIIDVAKLSKLLDIPVVATTATSCHGTATLKAAIGRAGKGDAGVGYGHIVEDALALLSSQMPRHINNIRKLSLLLLRNDPFIKQLLESAYESVPANEPLSFAENPEQFVSDIMHQAASIRNRFKGSLDRDIIIRRNLWIEEIAQAVTVKKRVHLGQASETFARLSRHPIFGIPILLGILFILYHLIVNVANVIAGWMNETLWMPVEKVVDNFLPAGFWHDFMIGDYGILTMGIANALLTVVPILSVFFIALSILEDAGYLPNLCVLTNRLFSKIGLSGNAIMPLILGFGCKTMATLSTRSLRSQKQRYIAIYMIAFAIPCAPQLALNISILGRMGMMAFVIAFSFLAIVEILAAVFLNKIIKKQEEDKFIQPLPAIRLPNLKAVIKKTYYRIYWFIKEAVPVFIYAAVALFVIDRIGALGAMKVLLKPVMEGLLGLPVSMVDALILCMVRQEAAAAMIIRLVERGELNYVQSIIAVVITTMFVPCFANIVAMIKELGAKVALIMVTVINTTTFLLGGILNWILIVLFRL